MHFPCTDDHEQDWQPYPIDPYSAICDDHTYKYMRVLYNVLHILTVSTRTGYRGPFPIVL